MTNEHQKPHFSQNPREMGHPKVLYQRYTSQSGLEMWRCGPPAKANQRTLPPVYPHRNPVRRGLVASPELWAWSSFRHYLAGAEGVVEIESQWTARKRESLGMMPQLRVQSQNSPRPVPAKRRSFDKDGAAREGRIISAKGCQPAPVSPYNYNSSNELTSTPSGNYTYDADTAIEKRTPAAHSTVGTSRTV